MSVETTEGLTTIDSFELGRRIDKGREERAGWAMQVCYALQEGRDTAYRLARFEAAESALEVLYAENSRRVDEYRARGLI